MSERRPPGGSGGFPNELRRMSVGVKLIILFTLLFVGSPFWMALLYLAGTSIGFFGVLLVLGGGVAFAVWLLSSPSPPKDAIASADESIGTRREGNARYCHSCGDAFDFSRSQCPACHTHWSEQRGPDTAAFLAAVLDDLTSLRIRGKIGLEAFESVRDVYEARMAALHGRTKAHPVTANVFEPARPKSPAPAPVTATTPVPAVAVHRPPVPARAAIPPKPPAEPRPSAADMGRAVVGWAAERQADILLYVGAFLLSVSAIIFVAYQGDTLNGGLRFAILSAYAFGFLGFGLILHRWERVKEAGPVFLTLGAILVPFDFIALRTQVLSEDQLPLDALWLLGSSASAALYFLLATRGYGRLYALPGIPAALAAWGALGSVLGLPIEALGAWFSAIAAAMYVTAAWLRVRWSLLRWVRALGVFIGAASILWTHGVVLEGGYDAALPVSYGFSTAGLAGGLWFRRDGWVLAILPLMGGATAATTWWASFGLALEWRPIFLALAGAGYLVTGYFDRAVSPRAWASVAVAASVLALLGVHASVLSESADREALPTTWLIVFVSASAAYGVWRWPEAAAAMPVAGAMTLLTTAWAARGTGIEWYGMFASTAGAGYLLLAHFQAAGQKTSWRQSAAACGVLGVAMTHGAVLWDLEAERNALPLTYAYVLVGAIASMVRWRWEWRAAPAALPVVAAMTALTAGWANWEIHPEWYGCFAAGAAMGYLVVAHFDAESFARGDAGAALLAGMAALAFGHLAGLEDGEPAALPAAYALVFVAAAGAFGRWRWAEAGALLPPLGAVAALTAWWAAYGLALEWYGAFAAAAAIGYLLLANFDRASRRIGWQSAALACAVLAIALAHATVAGGTAAAREALPVTYAVVLVAAVGAFARWRFEWRFAPGGVPLLAAMTALTASWAVWDVQPEWWGAFIVAAAFGYLAIAEFDSERWLRAWLSFAMVGGIAGVALTHGAVIDETATRGALPLAYGEALAASAFCALRWRWRYRAGVAAVPFAIAALGASSGWAFADLRLEWLTAWTALGAVLYLVPAALDREKANEWRRAAGVGAAAAIFAAHMSTSRVAPVRWQLPATYALVLAGACWDAVRVRQLTVLAPPILGAMLGASTLWALEVEPQWWGYPALGIAAVMMSTATWWERNTVLQKAGWAYATVLGAGATLVFLPVGYEEPWHGVASQLAAAAMLGYAAFRARGSIVALLLGIRVASPVQRDGEQAILLQAAFGFLLGAGASFNGAMSLHEADRAWTSAALETLAWLLVAAFGRSTRWYWTFTPAALTGMTIAAFVAGSSDGTLAAVLALATAGPLAAWAGSRRWTLLGVANSFLLLAVWAGWQWQELDTTWLPAAYAAVAVVEWAALIGIRRYTAAPKEADIIITYLSWGPWLVSAAVSGILLSQQQGRLATGESIVNTEEWALAAAVLGMAAAAVVGEGFRLRKRWVWLPGSVGLLVSLLMAIATREPENVQAYAAPVGVYLIVAMLTFQRSPDLFGKNMHLHEAVMLIGVLNLVLPPAEQSFEPGGGKFGLELLGIGIAVLIVGLALHARWLVPAAVATLTAVSLRMVTGGMFAVPYWLLFGLAGTLLLAFGVLVLLERERWDRFRHRVVEWWAEASLPGGTLSPPTSTPS